MKLFFYAAFWKLYCFALYFSFTIYLELLFLLGFFWLFLLVYISMWTSMFNLFCSRKKKNPDNIFTRITLNIHIYINPGRTVIFRMLDLLIQEYGMSFHLFKSICLLRVFWSFSHLDFAKFLLNWCLDILFAIANGIFFSIIASEYCVYIWFLYFRL